MNTVQKLIETARNEVGYLEKKSNSQLDSKTANAGVNNYTKYGAYFGHNGPDAYWCDYFVDWCFVQAFGRDKAKELLCGAFSGYTPTSAQHYKNRKQYHISDPLPGDQVFFHNSTRICHTGIVTKVTSTKVYTIEGNTSGGSEVIANGGGVCEKVYDLSNPRIDGYGRPDWSLVEPPAGWVQDDHGWWYRDADGSYTSNGWKQIDEKWYWFDGAGYMVSDAWKNTDGKWYYLGSDGSMAAGCLREIKGDVFAFDSDGMMLEGSINIKTNDRGALILQK